MTPHSAAARPSIVVLIVAAAAFGSAAATSAGDVASVGDAASWGYQLQGYDLDRLAAAQGDLLVVDYARRGRVDSEWTADDVARMQAGPCGRRLVVAYMSIGEAERFRFYWDALDPGLVGARNRRFRADFKVRYWEPAWHDVIYGITDGPAKSYLDRIVDQGFDGVYLDIVDAYEHFGPAAVGGNGERETAARDMIDLVAAIAEHAHETRGRPDFLVIPQNGSGIATPAAHSYAASPEAWAAVEESRYLAAIDAIAAEDTFFFGRRRMNNRLRPQTATLENLDGFLAAGKPVFAIDYISRRRNVRRFHELAEERGYVPLVNRRALSRRVRLVRSPPPDCE